MTTSLTLAMPAQDLGGALASRKATRENPGDDPAGFDAALSQSDDAQPESGAGAADARLQSASPAKDAFASMTASDGGAPASADAMSGRAASGEWTAKSAIAFAAGDRLASRMTAAWLDASSGSAAAAAAGDQPTASLVPAATDDAAATAAALRERG